MDNTAHKKALVMGFFSTVGDIDCLHVVERYLKQLTMPYDIAAYSEAVRKDIPNAKDPRTVDAELYTHLIIVCGPCWKDFFRKIDLSRFDHCLKVGVNLSMIDSLEFWNPFQFLIERDSERTTRPDLSFLQPFSKVPVVGRCLAPKQKEYKERQQHGLANKMINELIDRKKLAAIDIDTRWPVSRNSSGLKNTDEVISVIKRTDVLITTRLHGLVLALKAGVPAIVVDAIAGGDKVVSQARTIGWPTIELAEQVTPEWLDQALEWCLSPEGKKAAQDCFQGIAPLLADMEKEIIHALSMRPLPRDNSAQKKSSKFQRFLQEIFLRRS